MPNENAPQKANGLVARITTALRLCRQAKGTFLTKRKLPFKRLYISTWIKSIITLSDF